MKPVRRIRVITREQFAAFLEDSKAQGLDLAEVCDRAGVLLTPERKNAIEAQALDAVADHLESLPTHSLVPRTLGATLADLHRGIVESIRTFAEGVRNA